MTPQLDNRLRHLTCEYILHENLIDSSLDTDLAHGSDAGLHVAPRKTLGHDFIQHLAGLTIWIWSRSDCFVESVGP